jgi:uncharacterized protein
MKAKVSVITLGVADLNRAIAFYKDGLGLKTEGIIGTEFECGAVALCELDAGLKFAVWPRSSLARDAGLPVGPPSATEMSIGHNVRSRREVDTVMAEAKAAGAVTIKEAGRLVSSLLTHRSHPDCRAIMPR